MEVSAGGTISKMDIVHYVGHFILMDAISWTMTDLVPTMTMKLKFMSY